MYGTGEELAIVGVLGGTGYIAYQAYRARQEAKRAADEAGRMRCEAVATGQNLERDAAIGTLRALFRKCGIKGSALIII